MAVPAVSEVGRPACSLWRSIRKSQILMRGGIVVGNLCRVRFRSSGFSEGGGLRGGVCGLDGALAIGAAVEIGVHEASLEVGEELFIDIWLAGAGGDLVGDDAEAGAEFVDEAEERAAVD